MIWSLLVIPGLVGALLLMRGWRGRRIDNHPLCRRCGYDLVGSEQAVHCPECGRDLLQPRAVRIGHRRKRVPSVVLGATLLLISLGSGGALGWAIAKGIDFNPYKPLWMLRNEAAGTRPQQAINAQREILKRLNNGKLSKDQIDSIVHEALKAQPDPNATWFTWWGDVIEGAWARHDIGDDLVQQYLRNAITGAVSLDLPAKIRQGGMLRVQFTSKPMRAGNTRTFMCEISQEPVKFDDGSTLTQAGGMSRSTVSAGSSGHSMWGVQVNILPGWHHARAQATVRVGLAQNAGIGVFGAGAMGFRAGGESRKTEEDGDATWVMATWPLTLEADFEVVAPDAELVEKVRDPSLEPAIRKAVTVRRCSALDMRGMGAMLDCRVTVVGAPIDVAFEVLVRIGDREWPAGAALSEDNDRRIFALSTMPSGASQALARDFPDDASLVDIVLRPSEPIAEAGGLMRMWDGEIVIKDVPLERPFGR